MTDARPARRLAVTGAVTAALTVLAVVRRLLRGPRGRRPGDHPEDLLLPRGHRDRWRCWRSLVACDLRHPVPARPRRRHDEVSSICVGIGLAFVDPRGDHRLDLGQGVVGHLVGVDRPAPRDLRDRPAALRRLLRAALAPPRASGRHALLRRSTRSRPSPRCRCRSTRCGWRARSCTRWSSPRAGRTCRTPCSVWFVVEPARDDRGLPHDPAAGADPAPRRQRAAPHQAAAWRRRREHRRPVRGRGLRRGPVRAAHVRRRRRPALRAPRARGRAAGPPRRAREAERRRGDPSTAGGRR